jgi:hypothetical protein
MVEFTWQARSRLDEYLRGVRCSLRGCRSVDAAEVESNVREHVDSTFGEATGPVDVDELEGVLNELGSPLQWVAVEDLPWWRRMLLRWRSRQGGSRAAWLSFALLVLAAVSLVYAAAVPDYEYVRGPVMVRMNGYAYQNDDFSGHRIPNHSVDIAAGLTAVFLFASFVVARMVVSAGELAGQASPQRWLVYPQLACVYLPVLACVLAAPIAAGALFAEERSLWFEQTVDMRHASPAELARLRAAGPLVDTDRPDRKALPTVLYGWWRQRFDAPYDSVRFYVLWSLITAVVTLGWWAAVAFLLRWRPGLAQAVFRPFADRLDRATYGRIVLVILACLLATAAALAIVGRSLRA